MDTYLFARNINKTQADGIINTKTQMVVCLCNEENSKTILSALKDGGYYELELLHQGMKNQREAYMNEITKLREASEEILHLHLCEQEGIGSGQPTPKQWLDAVDKLSKILHP